MKKLRVILISVFLSACCGVAFGQGNIEQLNERRRKAEKQLEEIKGLIGNNTGDIRKSETALKLTRNGITAKREIVAVLDEEIARTTAEINLASRQTRTLDSTLTALKKDYGEFVYSAWKNHKMNNTTAFLLASQDFNDATRRISHIRRYNAARVRKGVEIDSLNTALKQQIEQLAVRKSELDETKARRNTELTSLRAEESRYDGAVKELKKDRKKLEARAKKERDNIAAAQRQIDRIMAEQTKEGKGKLTQADIVLSGKFEDNKGKLPWPVGGPGVVIDHFGTNRRADGIVKDSKGITIAARPGAEAKAVFEGIVTGVFSVGQFDRCVTVRSGSYVVLYGNLTTTNVKNGDTVAFNQSVGILNKSTDDDNRLIFQIWRETTALDPEQWLRK